MWTSQITQRTLHSLFRRHIRPQGSPEEKLMDDKRQNTGPNPSQLTARLRQAGKSVISLLDGHNEAGESGGGLLQEIEKRDSVWEHSREAVERKMDLCMDGIEELGHELEAYIGAMGAEVYEQNAGKFQKN